MTTELPIKVSKLKVPDKDTINEMIHIYQEAYKHDPTIQLQNVPESLLARMAGPISTRCTKPECEFIIARTDPSNRIIGWIALAFKLDQNNQISEEHVLLTQYALLPDIVAKCKSAGIDPAQLKIQSHKLVDDFKATREKHLPDKHCIISTLVVDPQYQHQGVASALLSSAIARTEVFCFPIWVPAPSPQKALFAKHDFEEISTYEIDLNEYIPEPDAKGKGKNKAARPLNIYTWTFMLRQKPLENALNAYKTSKIYLEAEEERRVDKRRRLNALEKKPGTKPSAQKSGAPKPDDILLGGDVQTAASGSSLLARDDEEEEEAGPSTPLLKKRSDWTAKTKAVKKVSSLLAQATKNAAKGGKDA